MTAKNIVIATDFGAEAQKAAEVAVEIADRNEAALHVVCVDVLFDGSVSGSLRKTAQELEKRTSRPIETHEVRSTSAASGVMDVAHRVGADLIVIGVPNRGGLGRMILGSTVGEVLRSSNLPVLAIPGTGGPMSSTPKLILALDLDEPPQDLLQAAMRQAAAWQGSLEVVHVIEPSERVALLAALPEVGPTPHSKTAHALELLEKELDKAREELGDEVANLEIQVRCLHGFAPDCLSQHLGTTPHDAVILGTHGRTGYKRILLGSVAEALVHRSGTPVLVLPDRALSQHIEASAV